MNRRYISGFLYMVLGFIFFIFISFFILRKLGILGIYPIFFLGAFLSSIFWVWMLIDCLIKESNEGSNKIAWILVILFTHLIGALVYYLVRRPQRIKELGR